MRIAGMFSKIKSVGRDFCSAVCFCLDAVLRGALWGLPFCCTGCVGFIGMVQWMGNALPKV